MKGDFSRLTFDPRRHYSAVLMQQGRVQLDSDWNEAVSISTHVLRCLAADLIGPHGGPGDGFKITRLPENTRLPLADLHITAGHYYVAGILCENDKPGTTYITQRDYPVAGIAGSLPRPPFLVYLEVWERHITAVEDGNLREPALGGADTSTRSQVVWQVKAMPLSLSNTRARGRRLVRYWQERARESLEHLSLQKGTLQARACSPATDGHRGTAPSRRSKYSGLENRLYRVEIHNGGVSAPSFKWSRDNASMAFPITQLMGSAVRIAIRDAMPPGLVPGDWVEMTDDDDVLLGRPGPLLQVQTVDFATGIVTPVGSWPAQRKPSAGKLPLLRRWNGCQPIRKTSRRGQGTWQDLEDGVQVQFGKDGDYVAGDYWLIPAREATGDVVWPTDPDGNELVPASLPPAGVEHYHAPLSALVRQKRGNIAPLDLRRVFKGLASD